MRKVATFEKAEDANVVYARMVEMGIDCQLDVNPQGHFEIWVKGDDQLPQAKEIVENFEKNGDTFFREKPEKDSTKEKVEDFFEGGPTPSASRRSQNLFYGPITRLTLLACAVIFLFSMIQTTKLIESKKIESPFPVLTPIYQALIYDFPPTLQAIEELVEIENSQKKLSYQEPSGSIDLNPPADGGDDSEDSSEDSEDSEDQKEENHEAEEEIEAQQQEESVQPQGANDSGVIQKIAEEKEPLPQNEDVPSDNTNGYEQALKEQIETEPLWPGFYNVLLHYESREIFFRAPLFYSISHGEVWRLVSPMFLHAGLLHFLFNMLWLWVLGRSCEGNMGVIRFVAFVLLTAVVTNTLQYLMTGPFFMGISGVLAAFAGYIWSRKKIAPWEIYFIDRGTLIFLGSFIFGLFGLQIVAFYLQLVHNTSILPLSFANTAHMSGVFLGLGLGRTKLFQRSI